MRLNKFADGLQPPTRFSHSSSSITSTPYFCGLLELRTGFRASHDESVFFETEPDTLAPSRSAMALASSRVIFSSEPVKTTVFPATGEEVLTASQRLDCHMLEKLVDDFDIVRLGEELDDRIADDVADSAYAR